MPIVQLLIPRQVSVFPPGPRPQFGLEKAYAAPDVPIATQAPPVIDKAAATMPNRRPERESLPNPIMLNPFCYESKLRIPEPTSVDTKLYAAAHAALAAKIERCTPVRIDQCLNLIGPLLRVGASWRCWWGEDFVEAHQVGSQADARPDVYRQCEAIPEPC